MRFRSEALHPVMRALDRILESKGLTDGEIERQLSWRPGSLSGFRRRKGLAHDELVSVLQALGVHPATFFEGVYGTPPERERLSSLLDELLEVTREQAGRQNCV